MRLAIGSDHAGYHLKQELLTQLSKEGIPYDDMGTNSSESCDYPDFAQKVAEAVSAGKADLGVLVCGTGQGMAMAANKLPGIRAAVAAEPYSARLSREHNDANVLCLGARVVGSGMALECLGAWLSASFQGGRHQRRVDKMAAMGERKG